MISDKELEDLISEHEQYGLMAHRNNNKDALKLIKSVIDALRELKEHRECELKKAVDDLIYAEKMQALLVGIKQEYNKVENELRLHKDCELRPAIKFINATLFQHNDKFIEEFNEVQAAFYDYTENSTGKNKEHLIEKIIDVQLAGETYLAGLGLNWQQRMAARCKKMKTNTERGYYDEK